MLDYAALRAVSAVAETGSFEKAAEFLGVTPSAVSQRVRRLEERLGAVLIVRGTPCLATETGSWLCRHVEHVGLLEAELLQRLPAPPTWSSGQQPRTVLHIGINADSLATWFLAPAAAFAVRTGHLIKFAVDDQDHTAEWLEQGRVVAAVTASVSPVQGCRVVPLGALRYLATASPDFVARHLPRGLDAQALADTPSLTFNEKDRLQERWARQVFGRPVIGPTHWLPSSRGFVDACLAGMGWGMNPEPLVRAHLDAGRLVELQADTPLDVPLHWQINRLAGAALEGLTQDILAAAHGSLVPMSPAA
ncbi:LysR family transcriptional regulator ArgP [Aureimonas frigidaquae]|uniref:Chromosome replication initiation inhibitor protein n=1 Tax=Aureimonas frigidaquae TaxID=424757 RepID=A0A0P0Z419_9HYPH|nr:LysR family transcriptional regulator ArgP [Aureimonas frigidaquae]BAT28884.1 chromosome replication initiation inhibitor protein [Aureimonas frigidaquae]